MHFCFHRGSSCLRCKVALQLSFFFFSSSPHCPHSLLFSSLLTVTPSSFLFRSAREREHFLPLSGSTSSLPTEKHRRTQHRECNTDCTVLLLQSAVTPTFRTERTNSSVFGAGTARLFCLCTDEQLLCFFLFLSFALVVSTPYWLVVGIPLPFSFLFLTVAIPLSHVRVLYVSLFLFLSATLSDSRQGIIQSQTTREYAPTFPFLWPPCCQSRSDRLVPQ